MPDPSFRLWSHTWILGRQARLQNGRHFDLANLSKDFFNVDVDYIGIQCNNLAYNVNTGDAAAMRVCM